jgi:flagellar biosynthesis/type III secretory pathway M-ring protein FliF/YscJ
MEDKSKYITPLLMLVAGALASIIMYLRKYEFTKMLWILLIVLVVFFVIGDTARYIYSRIRPRIIPEADYEELARIARENLDLTGNVVDFGNDEDDDTKEEESEETEEEEYSDDEDDSDLKG